MNYSYSDFMEFKACNNLHQFDILLLNLQLHNAKISLNILIILLRLE